MQVWLVGWAGYERLASMLVPFNRVKRLAGIAERIERMQG